MATSKIKSKSERTALIGEFQASGMTKAAWCKEKGSITWPEETDDETTMDVTLSDFKNLIKAPGVKQKIKRQEVSKIP